jgi:hypothetical protein
MTIQFNNTTDTITATGSNGTLSGFTIPAQATGGAIWINNELVSANVTIGAGQNGFTVGPMATANGVSVTVASGQRLVVI